MMKRKFFFCVLAVAAVIVGSIYAGLAGCRGEAPNDLTRIEQPGSSPEAQATPETSEKLSPEEEARLQADIAALEKLASLQGATYVKARDKLLAEHPRAFDIEEIAAESWKAGLAAFLIGVRRSRPELYQKWDADESWKLLTIKGDYQAHPATKHPDGLPFCVELCLFQTAGPKEQIHMRMVEETLQKLLSGRRQVRDPRGHVVLWKAVWQQAPQAAPAWRYVRLVALRVIAADAKSVDAESFKFIRKVFARSNADEETKRAILEGLAENPSTNASLRRALTKPPPRDE